MNISSNGEAIYGRLLQLQRDTAQTIHERLRLADELLADSQWVLSDTGGGGSLSAAFDCLEKTAFADICGALSLGQMLEILHHVPDITDWRKANYNLRQLYQEMKARTRDNGRRADGRQEEAKRDEESQPLPNLKVPAKQDSVVSLLSTEEKLEEALKENAKLKRQIRELTRRNEKLSKAIKRMMMVAGLAEVAAT